jgi:hypothetical protein
MILITLRLLMPPGICVCQAASPAGKMLANLLHNDAPQPDPFDDDHNPGCPASIFSSGLGVFPTPVPALHLLPNLPPRPVLPADLPAPRAWLLDPEGLAAPVPLPAGLQLRSLCALVL